MKIKMILIKKKQIQQQRRPLKFLNATKKRTQNGTTVSDPELSDQDDLN